jgi:hypothetical protein
VKVRKSSLRVPALLGRLLLAIPLSVALTMAVQTAPASAITRDQVIQRANTWVKKRVPYSQSGYYRGYRRDCSGMVSMAWGLKTSYTSGTIGSRATRVSKKNLKPGDAVYTPGHVSVFVGWANKKKTRYRVMEQSQSGKPALKRTRTWRRGSKGLRLRGIQENPPVLVASAPSPAPAAPVAAAAPMDPGAITVAAAATPTASVAPTDLAGSLLP